MEPVKESKMLIRLSVRVERLDMVPYFHRIAYKLKKWEPDIDASSVLLFLLTILLLDQFYKSNQ